MEAGNEIFVGAIQPDGDITVARYDASAEAFETPVVLHAELEVDDHDNPALLVRASDNRLIAFCCEHAASAMYMRVSTNPLDLEEFAA